MLDAGAESPVVVDEISSEPLNEVTGPVVGRMSDILSEELTGIVWVTSEMPGLVVIVVVPDLIVTVTACVVSTVGGSWTTLPKVSEEMVEGIANSSVSTK